MTGEERVLPVQRDRKDGPLDGIVVELDAAIGEEQHYPWPVFGDVAQGLPERRFRGDASAMKVKPCLYPRDGWSGSFLASSEPLFGAEDSDLGFDGIELADEPHTLFRNRGSAGAGDLDQLATGMGPATGELDTRSDAAGGNQSVIAGIAIHLQDAAKALQYPFGMKATSAGGMGEGNAWWRRAPPGLIIAGQRPEVTCLGFRAPGSSTGARVSSMNNLDDRFRSVIRAS